MPKAKKVTKQISIKEITDAFYSGASPQKLKRMMKSLVKHNEVPETQYTRNNHFDK